MPHSGNNFTPTVYPSTSFRNTDLNAPGSGYADTFTHNETGLIERITKQLVFDAAPQQFFDLKLLAMKPFERIESDEWYYHEMGYGRDPVTLGVGGITGGAPTQAGVAVTELDVVAIDTILVLPDNTKVIVTAKSAETGAGTIAIASLDVTGTAPNLPAVAAGQLLAQLSPVEADGADAISQYFRITTDEYNNYVQMVVKAMRFGKMELFKYQNAGSTANYLSMQKQRMIQQFRIDLSNILWNGQQGEVTVTNSGATASVAKTTGGIFEILTARAAPTVTTPAASVDAALETLALNTEMKAYGATRFLYGTPAQLHNLSQLYKRSATRYTPNDEIAKLQLTAVDIGSSKIVFVPMRRFADTASFPASWQNRLILLDQESVSIVQTWGEEMGETLDRRPGGTLQNYQDFWISTTFGVQFNNALGSGIINIT